MRRLQFTAVQKDLKTKMVFLVGPRQVGKTWLAKELMRPFAHPLYLNYDHLEDRGVMEEEAWLQETDLLVFDEIHKMRSWKNYLKGVYDTKPSHLSILVTGSARLDTFRQGGDSLAGRYFTHRLLPFSVAELAGSDVTHVLDRLLARGGFPEPFLAESDQDAQRWRKQYMDSLVRTDVLDFEQVHDIRAMQTTVELLRRRVGSPVSFASLARDAGVAPATMTRYVAILEALYIVFRVTPYAQSIARSIRKEPKLYFFDTGMVVGDTGARLENTVAVCLLKHCYAMEDGEGVACKLHTLRTKDGKETDFCIVRDDTVEHIIEVKVRDRHFDPDLLSFCSAYGFSGIQLVQHLRMERRTGSVTLRRAEEWLGELRL
jgi:predicted AAA+ superfamily ATPase